MQIPLASGSNQQHWDVIMSAPSQIEGDVMPPRVAAAVKSLWADRGVQTAYKRKNEIQLNDSASYYFDHIDEIAGSRYLPSDQDVLRSRVVRSSLSLSFLLCVCVWASCSRLPPSPSITEIHGNH